MQGVSAGLLGLQTGAFQDCPQTAACYICVLANIAGSLFQSKETLACYSCVLAGRLFQATSQPTREN